MRVKNLAEVVISVYTGIDRSEASLLTPLVTGKSATMAERDGDREDNRGRRR